MDNNKNLMRSKDISNSEKRKMFHQTGSNIGIVDGEKIGNTEEQYTKHSKLSHNK